MANELIYQSDFTGQQMDERFRAVATLAEALTVLEQAIAAKYTKPDGGIPASDLDADVNAALAKANSAVQSLADYYTKSEVDQLLAAINGMEYVDVATLPTASASTMGKIYLVGPDGSGYYSYYFTSYDGSAYSWVGPLGTTQISLANYATKAELSQLDQQVNGVWLLKNQAYSGTDNIRMVLSQACVGDTKAYLAISGTTSNIAYIVCYKNWTNIGVIRYIDYTGAEITLPNETSAIQIYHSSGTSLNITVNLRAHGDLSKINDRIDADEALLQSSVGTLDTTVVTQGTDNTNSVWFQQYPSLPHIDRIDFIARTGTTYFHKVKASGNTFTVTAITSVETAAADNDKVKSVNVNVDLGPDEYLGINGAFRYNSGGVDGFIGGYCGADGTSPALNVSGFAIGFKAFCYVNTLAELYARSSKNAGKQVFTVGKTGQEDFTDIYEALKGTYGLDSATNPVAIVVMPGTYETPTLPVAKYFSYCSNRYLSIVGVDKENCIIRNDNGYYNAVTTDTDNLGDNSPLKVWGNVYIANLTIVSTDADNAEEADAVYHSSYCIHADSPAFEGSTLEIHNCALINNHAPCIGFAIPKNCTLKITDSELQSDFWNPSTQTANAVIYGHDRGGSTSEVEEHVIVKNCIIKSSNGYVFKSVNNDSAKMDCVFVFNACDVPSDKHISLGAYTEVVSPSFGNNVSEMNME